MILLSAYYITPSHRDLYSPELFLQPFMRKRVHCPFLAATTVFFRYRWPLNVLPSLPDPFNPLETWTLFPLLAPIATEPAAVYPKGKQPDAGFFFGFTPGSTGGLAICNSPVRACRQEVRLWTRALLLPL